MRSTGGAKATGTTEAVRAVEAVGARRDRQPSAVAVRVPWVTMPASSSSTWNGMPSEASRRRSMTGPGT